MATKVPQAVKTVQEDQTTALAMLQQSETPMVQVTPDASVDLFPQLKIVYSIEVKPDSPFKENDAWTVGFTDGKTFQKLEAPYVMCVLAGRNAVRKLIYPNGWNREQYDAAVKSAKAARTALPPSPKYHRAYAKLGERGESHDAYIELCKDEFAEIGSTMIVLVWGPNGAGIGEFPLFKTAGSYFRNRLLQSSWQKRIGLKVLVSKHFDNLTTGKSGNAYLDAKKFVQCETIALTDEQIAAVPGLAKQFSAAYEEWLCGREVRVTFDE